MDIKMPEWLEALQAMWQTTSLENKVIMLAMLAVMLGVLSQVGRMTGRKKYRGKTPSRTAMEMLSNLELENVKSAYQKARECSRRYDYMMQLSARLPKEDVEPEYNIYVPVDDKSELRSIDARAKVKAWIGDNPQMKGVAERSLKSSEKLLEFEKALSEMPQPESKEEFDTSIMGFNKYREVEAELVNEAIKKARPEDPKFTFHFYHRSSKGRSTAEVTKSFSSSELMELWNDAEAYSSRY